MMNKSAVFLASLLTCLVSVASFAGQLGDPAPALSVAAWVKGSPVNLKAGTNVNVLIFCTLSRLNDFGLTTLGDLQKKYQDQGVALVVISDEPAETLKPFVQLKADKIPYAVAADNVRKTTLDYSRTFQQMVLPRGYVVGKEGQVLWHGHPAGGLDAVLAEITSGRYHLDQMKKDLAAREEMETYLAFARKDQTKGKELGRRLLTLRTNDALGLCDLAFQIATNPYLEQRDVALATAALDRAEQLSSTNATTIALSRAILLFQTGHETDGIAKAKQALADAKTPEDKDQAQSNIRAMELRLAAAKPSQTNAPASKP
jgi:hypothetical protein